MDSGSSPISSRNTVPPSASSKRPFLLFTAPVNAPFSYPKSSLSIRFSGMAPQLMRTIRWSRRSLLSWISRATTSLPVPVSPRIITLTEEFSPRSAMSDRIRLALSLLPRNSFVCPFKNSRDSLFLTLSRLRLMMISISSMSKGFNT